MSEMLDQMTPYEIKQAVAFIKREEFSQCNHTFIPKSILNYKIVKKTVYDAFELTVYKIHFALLFINPLYFLLSFYHLAISKMLINL